MSVYVCLKQVPNVEGVPVLDPAAGFLKADAWFLNPLDAYALKGALAVAKELRTDMVAVSAGGPEAEECLRSALGLGAERALLASPSTAVPGMPGPALTAWLLAGAILADAREAVKAPSLVFCGRQSSDMANLQVPHRLAAYLGFGIVSEVSAWKLGDEHIDIFRQAGNLRQAYRVELPCVLALNRGQGDLPRPTLPGLLAAKKKSVRILPEEQMRNALPERFRNRPADPVLVRARALEENRRCRMAEGANAEEKTAGLVAMLRAEGCLP